MSKRAFNITTSETSACMWGIGLIFTIIALIFIIQIRGDLAPLYPGIATYLVFSVIMIIIGIILSFISMFMPNYQISKNNLNIFIDRITNPDFTGWLRVTRNNRIRIHVVKNGPLGQTKGLADGVKADIFNDGKSTLTTTNGNQMILVSDFLSTNIDLKNAIGWRLINKHYGLIGYDAWEKAADDEELIFKIEGEGNDEKEGRGKKRFRWPAG